MAVSVGTVLLYSLPAVGSLIAGGIAAAFWRPGPVVRSSLQHFAAGVVFAVVAVELLPDVRRRGGLAWVAGGFTAGVVVMLALRWFSDRQEGKARERGGRWPWGLLAAVGVDVLIDGLLLGLGFAVGAREGLLLALAMAAEFLSLGLATSATLGQTTRASRVKVIGATAALALPFVAGAALGGTVLGAVGRHPLAALLAFGCAALLYLVTEELLVEAHEVEETTVASALFFAGFLLFLLLGMLV